MFANQFRRQGRCAMRGRGGVAARQWFRQSQPAIEALESRLLLAADLAVTIGVMDVPQPIVPGDSLRVPVVVTNLGDEPISRQMVRVDVLASLDAALDAGDVTASMSAATLTLKPGQSKTLTIKFNATASLTPGTWHFLAMIDGDAAILEPDEANNTSPAVGPHTVAWSFGQVQGRRGATKLLLTDADGTATTFKLSGDGMGQIIPDEQTGQWSLEATGTTPTSSIKVAAKGGDGAAELTSIHVPGSLKKFDGAKKLNLLGDATFGGGVGTLKLGDVVAARLITIGQTPGFGGLPNFDNWPNLDGWPNFDNWPGFGGFTAGPKSAKLAFGRTTDLSIDSQLPIASLQMIDGMDGDGEADTIAAPSLGKLLVKGDKDAQSAGDFAYHLKLSGTDGAKKTLGKAAIAGRLGSSGAQDPTWWRIDGEGGTIAAGDVTAWRLRVDGTLKAVKVANVTDAQAMIAGDLGTFDSRGDVRDLLLLSGVEVGADDALGGSDDAATVGGGRIGTLRVAGAVTNLVAVAGAMPQDRNLLNGDDELTPEDDGDSRVNSVMFGGEVSGRSVIAARRLPSSLQMAGRRMAGADTALFSDTPPNLTELIELRTDISRMVAGIGEVVQFEASSGPFGAGGRVSLYDATEQGATGPFMLELFDDGSASHGDARAGDGIFSNLLAIDVPEPGVRRFGAGQRTKDATVFAEITAIAAPTAEVLQQRAALAADAQTMLDHQLQQGIDEQHALEQLRLYLMGLPEGVDHDSVEVTDGGVHWLTEEGILSSALLHTHEASDQRAGAAPVIGSPPAAATAGSAGGGSADDEEYSGSAIVLGSYFWQFEPGGGDESDDVADLLRDAGFDVTYKANITSANQNISVDDFKNLGQYDTVVITSHGDGSRHGVIILTGDKIDGTDLTDRKADLVTGRVGLVKNTFSITPRFIKHYTGSMDDSIVYVGACRSAYDRTMANAFLGLGAAAYIGYTDYVGSGFAFTRGLRTYNHLLDDKTVGTIPGINKDKETDKNPALFTFFGDASAKLPRRKRLLNDHDLQIEYRWAVNQRDLDTGTMFLTHTAGFACGDRGPYLNFSGDDTSTGGLETVLVDLNDAFDAGEISTAATVALNAGWYRPANGSGPATLTVALKHKTTGKLLDVATRLINPGIQDNCAATTVGTVNVKIKGSGDGAQVFIRLV